MKKISQSVLQKQYGIDLPFGKFKIYVVDNNYIIYSIKDDTEGCLLLGKQKTAAGIRDCAERIQTIIELIDAANTAGIESWITVE